MSGDNKYILNLHHNSQNSSSGKYNHEHAYAFPYRYSQKVNIIALYDEGFGSSYYIGDKYSGSLYGSLSTSNYSFSGTKFKALIIYPELGVRVIPQQAGIEQHAVNTLEYLYFKFDGKSKLYLVPHEGNFALCDEYDPKESDPSSKALKSDKHSTSDPARTPHATLHTANVITNHPKAKKIIIPLSDIKCGASHSVDPNKVYEIHPGAGNDEASVHESNSTNTKIGTLTNETLFLFDSKLCKGNIFNDILPGTNDTLGTSCTPGSTNCAPGGTIELTDIKTDGFQRIALFRDRLGELKYYFSDKSGNKTSDSVLKNFCDNLNDCKMKDLNLFPNIRTYLKSTLVSADIGDFQGTSSVDQAAVSLNVTNTLKSDLEFQKAVTGVYGQDGQDANSAEIVHKLAHNPRFKRSLRGDKGDQGPPGHSRPRCKA